jgi:hypothetical protein
MKVESPRMFDFDFEPEEKPGSWKVQDEPFTILFYFIKKKRAGIFTFEV